MDNHRCMAFSMFVVVLNCTSTPSAITPANEVPMQVVIQVVLLAAVNNKRYE
jgi:hypothetical protein